MLPLWLREKGIYTQKELAMALMPYLEWIPYQDLRVRFFKIIDTHGSDAPLRCILQRLHKEGLIEKKYEGRPKGVNPQIEKHLCGFLFVRRISRSVPRTHSGIRQKADGTFGMRADKIKAKQAQKATRPQKAPKTSVKKLTMEDLRYIQSKPEGISDRAMGEMFGIQTSEARSIRLGHVPAHLRGQLAQ